VKQGNDINPSKGVEGVLYGGKLFMKKKLVSILLSLSMCASFGTPLTSVAADEVSGEDITVVETVAPNAKVTEANAVSTSPSAFNLVESGSGVTVEYGDTLTVNPLSCYKYEGSWAKDNGKEFVDTTNIKADDLTLTLAKSTDKDYVDVGTNTIKVKKLTKNNAKVPIIVSVKATDKRNSGSVTETAQFKLQVTLAPKNLSDLEPGELDGSYSNPTKFYKSLTDFENKFKKTASKGLTVKINGTQLAAKDIDTVTAKGDGTKVGSDKFYTKESTVTGGAVSTTASISVKGKGNYTGTCTISEQAVSIYPQRLNVGTISGAIVTFGSIESLLDGLTKDDYTELDGSTDKDKAKNYKFTTTAKSYIKIDSKEGKVSVKKIDDTTESNNTVTVVVTNKKNPDCTANLTFKIVPKDISTNAGINFDTVGIYGKTANKTYKNFVEFLKKFNGKDVTKPKGTGIKVTYPKPTDTSKKITMKVNKDYKITFKPNGTISGKTAEDKFEPTAYYTNIGGKTYVATTGTLVVEGIGNYQGVITDDAFEVPLVEQCITASSLDAKTGCSVTFRGEKKNIYDYIAVDLSNDSVKSKNLDSASLKKLFKVTTTKKELTVDKDGNITVKSVPTSKESTIGISLKRNSKSVDGLYKLKVKINPAVATDKSLAIVFDKANFQNKASYKSVSDAEAAAKKIKVKTTIDGKSKTLKAGTDYEQVTVKKISSGTTGSAFEFELSANFKGNYTGTITDSAVCKIPK
jgi:hypothetical protein